jgi:hypothetical protein
MRLIAFRRYQGVPETNVKEWIASNEKHGNSETTIPQYNKEESMPPYICLMHNSPDLKVPSTMRASPTC